MREETKVLRAALQRHHNTLPSETWCRYIEDVARRIEVEEIRAGALLGTLAAAADQGADADAAVAHLRELWAERVEAEFPEPPPLQRPRSERRKETQKARKQALRRRLQKKPDVKRLKRLAARITLLQQKSGWKRTPAEEAELANLQRQLAKFGLKVQ